MMMLILLLLMPVPQQGGKVILNVGVPEAEFYLDANFVAVTDKNGMLTMENFPSGSFSYSITKKGYKTYNGSFSIQEGEDKNLTLTLEKTSEAEKPDGQVGARSDIGKSSYEQPRRPVTPPPAVTHRLPAPNPSTESVIPLTGPEPEQASSDESDDTLPVVVFIVLLAIGISAFGILFWKMKHVRAQIPVVEEPPEIETEESPADIAGRPAPEFIEELKRREELMNAGFVGSKPRNGDPEQSKEKEIVIVLPKEAFRYEEDK